MSVIPGGESRLRIEYPASRGFDGAKFLRTIVTIATPRLLSVREGEFGRIN